ncbi:MAG: hypothetical protein LBR22_06250 [Desulfovibrio sp.]|nr:hypothetical protein [Desulfovibrio sp.]
MQEGTGRSPEEIEADIQGRNRTHQEGLGQAWAVVTGQNPANVVPQVVGTVLHEGGTRPPWQWKRDGLEYVFMAWPSDQPIRAGVLMRGEEGGQMKPATAIPLIEGLPNDMCVEEVHPWQDGCGANVSVIMTEGHNPMWFYDPFYHRDQDDLTPGVTHTFLLAGLAFGLGRALLDEMTLTRGERFEAYAKAWLEENPGSSRLDVPPLKLRIAGRHLIFPGRFFCEYQIRAPVEKIDECMLERMPVKALYLRFPFEDRPPMLLPVYATQLVLGEYAPKVGDEVDAYVWLQGRIADGGGSDAEAVPEAGDGVAPEAGDGAGPGTGMFPGTAPVTPRNEGDPQG